jgi:pimeloyl-ACP methyl ester carboxylesterase
LVLELFRRHPTVPRSLVLAGAYAGWSGSLDPEEVDRRLRLSLRLADLPPEQIAAELVPSMFSTTAPPEAVASFAANLLEINPAGFRLMSQSVAEADLRSVLAAVDVPTLLLYGDQDVRAPSSVADALHSAIPRSRLVVMPGVGHASPVEAPELFNRHLRAFLRSTDD